MKTTILDFQDMKALHFDTKQGARDYYKSLFTSGDYWDELTRYIDDWTLEGVEWLEKNCHNNTVMVYPTNKVTDKQAFDMVRYWHEQIAYGSFGDESVAFDFGKANNAYDEYTKQAYIGKTLDGLGLEDVYFHDGCDHESDEESDDCEDYQLDDMAYRLSGSLYGGASVSSQEMREAILDRMFG